MSLPDSAEYWWNVKGYYWKDKPEHKDVVKHNATQKRNQQIRRQFKKRYPDLTHRQISLLAKVNGGYLNIKGKNLENLIQP